MVYDKDCEYGYKHICTLSGGLDSRSIAFIANKLGYKDQCFITMAQSGSPDATISSKMAGFLNGEHIIYELDNGNYLKEVELAIRMNGGTITYPGLIHMYKLLDKLNLDNYGLIHTGEIGDFLFGGTLISDFDKSSYKGLGAFSHKLIDRISNEFNDSIDKKYESSYQFLLYNRLLGASVNGWYAAHNMTDSSSAFVDKNFMEFALSIPFKYKVNSSLYKEWMKRKIPDACNFKWESNNSYPDDSVFNIFYNKAIRKINRKITKKNYSMNPHEKWYRSNKDLKCFIDDSIKKMIDLLSFNNQLFQDCYELGKTGTVNEKMQILTLLYTIKEYHINQ